ncbi:hypothetical protein FVEG_08095 [Fusarium verticillioides 7600]|uniref:Uncharacterized protein n=1 Tax=Gibberella moniliformis (strain M3125 / FGSC 7600) TaxID=334819 RepID=W7MB71_GIBM7|nr:hypothetical protein FVEG_08095 [Fusarium verticillioides 7600]EWG48261.1 hypothetical protein FVEG_08095 [Fusarium verticillioides 7600]
MKINNWTDRGIRYIRFGVATDEPHWKRIGLSFLRRAQAEAASPLLHVAKKISEQLPFDQDHHPASNIINERIERRSKKEPNLRFRLAEYNDTINLEERSRIQYAFNLSSGGPEVVLLSAGAGGSHMVIAEPPWTPGKIDQVIGGGPIGFLKTNKSIYGT